MPTISQDCTENEDIIFRTEIENMSANKVPSESLLEHEYKVGVLQKKATNASKKFDNRGPVHARFVVQHLIEIAQKSIHIFSGNFSEDCYGSVEVKSAIETFLAKPDVAFQLIVQDGGLHANQWKDSIVGSSKIKIRGLDSSQSLEDFGDHFMVADGTAYRCETDHPTARAFCSFNDPEIAEMLLARFKKLWLSANL
jgi:hypothetical protein